MKIKATTVKIFFCIIALVGLSLIAASTLLGHFTERVVEHSSPAKLKLVQARWMDHQTLHGFELSFSDEHGKIYKGFSMAPFAKWLSYTPCFDFYEKKVNQSFTFAEETGVLRVPIFGDTAFDSKFETNMMQIACVGHTGY